MKLSRNTLLAGMLVLVWVLSTACQPIRSSEGATQPSASVTEAHATSMLAGRYSGTLAIAGMELAITVNLREGAGSITGTIDIPGQGASGIPLHDIRVALPALHFEMLEGPLLAVFEGELAADGEIRGTFFQSGVQGSFVLAPEDSAGEGAAAARPATSGLGETYTDPAGRYSVPVPTNWRLTEGNGYVLLSDPEESIKMYLAVLPGTDLAQATLEGWKRVDPAFAVPIDETVEPPAGSDVEAVLVTTYDTHDVNRILQAVAQGKNGDAYLLLIDGQLSGLQKRNAQASIVASGFKILAVEETDLTGVMPLPIDAKIILALEDFIATYMEAFGIPGAAVGIVENSELVYSRGFGVADPVTGERMEPDTHVMIGSTGKSLTTMMMGTLVDDGIMAWDTPAIALYPEFKVMDAVLTEQITMRNLVCACTGVPRRDLELIFNASEQVAEDTVAALADFEFFTDFGEAFQYSNQMVATGGFIAANAAQNSSADLGTEYATALQQRILDPIGMENTTISFDVVQARGRYAIPHTLALDGRYVPIALESEHILIPVAPAGSHWSTLADMARYMITELNEGVAPDGTRVISAANLKETWTPQIALSNEASYGLGWIVTEYLGLPVLTHGGNTIGFTSSFTFLPGRGFGVIVLTNGRATNMFNEGIASRLLELVYGQPAEASRNLDFYLQQMEKETSELASQIKDEIDTQEVESYLGRFTNDALGVVELSLVEGKLMLDAGEFVTQLKAKYEDAGDLEGYMQTDPPLQGTIYKFERAADGTSVIVLGEGAVQYRFVVAQ